MTLTHIIFDTMKSAEHHPQVQDILKQIETEIGQTVGFGHLIEGTELGTVTAVVRGTASFSFNMELGHCYPIHASAPGKCILAFMKEPEREQFLSTMSFEKFTLNTITSRRDFEEELESVRKQGYGLDVSEELEGCHCIGVPVFGKDRNIIGCLWTTGPATQLPVRTFEPVIKLLRRGASEITRRMTGSGRASSREHINAIIDQARIIIENKANEPLDTEELAVALSVGYTWFRRIFKEQVGLPPAAYHRHCRIEKAKELLLKTDLSIREIADQLGYPTPSQFSATFKKQTGQSPQTFRHDRPNR